MPWFYFIANAKSVVKILKNKYIKCDANLYNVHITILSQGKEDFLNENGMHDSLGNIFTEDDWVNAFEWIRFNLVCSDCKFENNEWLDFETM